jgi:hypothetical protein
MFIFDKIRTLFESACDKIEGDSYSKIQKSSQALFMIDIV